MHEEMENLYFGGKKAVLTYSCKLHTQKTLCPHAIQKEGNNQFC